MSVDWQASSNRFDPTVFFPDHQLPPVSTVLTRSVCKSIDHLLRYEASLERSFDRTLSQLERVQLEAAGSTGLAQNSKSTIRCPEERAEGNEGGHADHGLPRFQLLPPFLRPVNA